MAYIVPNIRKVNAKLGQKEVNFYGKRWAIQDNLDGYSVVDVSVEQAPSEIKQYLEGNSSITIYPIASNVVKICDYALASFPNIETIYLFKKDNIVSLETNAFATLNNLTSIYVPSDLIGTYKSTYTDLESKFVGIPSEYEWEVPYLGTDIDVDLLGELVSMLSAEQKNAITKIVFPTAYEQDNVTETAWKYDFSKDFPNLNNNVYYGTQKINFTEIVISGSGALTSEIVDSAIGNVSSDKKSVVSKLVVSNEFVSISQEDYDLFWNSITENLPNVDTIEMSLTLNTRDGGRIYIAVSMPQIKHIVINKVGTYGSTNMYYAWYNVFPNLETLEFANADTVVFRRGYRTSNAITTLLMPNVKTLNWDGYSYYPANKIGSFGFKEGGDTDITLPELETISQFAPYFLSNTKLRLPKIKAITMFGGLDGELYIGTSDCVLNSALKIIPTTIYIPRGSLSYYQNATNWSAYADKFVEYDF